MDVTSLSAIIKRVQCAFPQASSTDPAGFADAAAEVAIDSLQNPERSFGIVAGHTLDLIEQVATTIGVAMSGSEDVLPEGLADKRFADPAWRSNPLYAVVLETYLTMCRLIDELVEAAEVDPRVARKASFVATLLTDALAPTNVLVGNPAALKRAFDTGGRSVFTGTRQAINDLARQGGRPSKVDTTQFRIGETLAATPSAVVYRNDLIELLQYSPQTADVFEVPLLCSPPWINKYYIMDLSPGRSLIEAAVQAGHTVFAISYRNPDESMRETTFDDYLEKGPLAALEVIGQITGASRLNVVGLCLGGVMAAATAAHLAARGEDRIASLTLLNTMLDYTDPGVLGCFVDEAAVDRLAQRMQVRGYLEAQEMADTFDLLRANDLIFGPLVRGWLKGERPAAFDILAWNDDATRMPARMHADYLRACYVENRLARGMLELAGHRLDLGTVDRDAYVVSARNDHIVPWQSAYRTTQLLGGSTRFVLSSGGHIAGVVNPPGGRGSFTAGPGGPGTTADWLNGAAENAGSWWTDWLDWIGDRAGGHRPPSPIGSDRHHCLGPGPGQYVRG
jgi:poly[(R)-3-hydroxyalkanoate] polymerase subunit PhaC